jgi:hypothetical protein
MDSNMEERNQIIPNWRYYDLVIKDSKNSTKKLSGIIHTVSNVSRYNNQYIKVAFLYTNNEHTE